MSQDEPKSLLSTLRSLFRRGQPAPEALQSESEAARQWHVPEIAITADNRDQLLRFAREAPLAYGAWADLKRLYKQAEQNLDFELLAPLIARLDAAPLPANPYAPLSRPLDAAEFRTITFFRMVGSHAYLIATDYRSSSLHVLDCSDPLRPQPISRMDFASTVLAFDVDGTRMVLVTQEGVATARFIDVSSPQNPAVVARMELNSTVAVAFSGDRLITASRQPRTNTLSVIDVTDLRHPALVGNTWIDYPPMLRVAGNVAYAYGYYSGRLTRYDITPHAGLNRTGQFQIASIGASDCAIHGGLLAVTIRYGSRQPAGLYLYALDRLQQPLGFLALNHAVTVDLQGDYAYVGTQRESYNRFYEAGLHVIDIRDPARPQRVGQVNGGDVKAVIASDRLVYFCMQPSPDEVEAVRAADVTDPTRPILLGRSPGRATLGYMKRRARRLLRTMAAQTPDRYIELAVRLLSEAGAGRRELDPSTQWVSMDLLYGGGTHWQQAAHGRGGYHSRPDVLRLRTRAERHPELWDRHPDQAAALALNPELPWQVHEAAIKMLRGMGAFLPALPERMAARYLESPSPLLIALGARAVAGLIATVAAAAAEVAAETYYKGSGRTRSAVRELLIRQEPDRTWGSVFAERLLQLATASSQSGALSRRQSRAFACLVARFPDRLKRLASPRLIISLYATRRPDLAAWAFTAFDQMSPDDIEIWLEALEPLPDDLRTAAMERILPQMRGHRLGSHLLPALAYHASPWIRAVGWDLIAASAAETDNIRLVWNGLLETDEITDALRTAMESPAALALLDRISYLREKIEALLPTRPFLLALLPPEALRSMLEVLPASALPALIATAAETKWPVLRPALLALLCTEAPRVAATLDGRTRCVAIGERQLPQGACTSPAITNLLCRRMDARLTGIARAYGFTYTRYADGLVFSHPGLDAPVGPLLGRVQAVIEAEGYTLNSKKTRVMRPQHRQAVTGVVVNGTPRISRRDLRRFRAFLHHCETEGLLAVSERIGKNAAAYAGGYLAFTHMVNPEQAAKLRQTHPWLAPYQA